MARHGFESHEAATSAEQEHGDKDNDDNEQEEESNDDTEPSPKRLKRQSTMAVTAEVKTHRFVLLQLFRTCQLNISHFQLKITNY